MARTSLTVNAVLRSGFNLSSAAKTLISTDGVRFVNTGKEILYLENIDVGDIVVTIQTGKTVDDLAVTDRTVTMQETGTAGDIQVVGPFPTDTYNQASLGEVYVDAATIDKIKAIVLQITPVA